MGIRIYRKAGYKAMKNTTKKDQVSCYGENRYIHIQKKLPIKSVYYHNL